MKNMRWSEAPLPDSDGGGGGNGTPTTPQIKNHSVTYHRGYLYCFGGYDGRRNHQTLLIYSLREGRWITPAGTGNNNGVSVGVGVGGNNNRQHNNDTREHFTVRGVPPPGRNGHTATLATCRSSRSRRRRRNLIANGNNNNADNAAASDADADAAMAAMDPSSAAQEEVKQAIAELASAIDAMDAELDTNENNAVNDNTQGGDDDVTTINHNHLNNPNEEEEDDDGNDNQMNEDDDDDDDDDDEDAQIIIIGGWLGSGPLAASDMWVLDISGGLERLHWFQPPTVGTPPGPCNMHSADFIPSRGKVYVFRGGNGREYLNDLHALDVETYTWRAVQTHGVAPQQRANHSSALLDHNGKSELFIFGGWNGSERLNDIHVLDTATSTWSTPRVLGVKPHPRAGMTLTALRGRLYLFGGSGTSSKCFDDLQVLDRKEMAWLDVNEEEEESSSNNNNKQQQQQQHPSPYYDNSLEMTTGGANNSNNNRDPSSSWEMLGGQDGMMMGGGGGNNNDNDTGIKFADWRSYSGTSGGVHHHPGGGCISSVANPNDEDMVPSVYVNGKPPGRRAGHTATAVGRHIYVFGGSCGTDYLNDFFVLDTDPPPLMKITEPPSPQLYASRLRHFYNDEEFSDVTFLVEGRKVFGHKLVLSTVSDCFRAMFMTGFRESGSEKTEIEIPNCSYSSFCTMMEYIYTGRGPHDINVYSDEHGHNGMDRAISLLELADQFFLYNLKQIIEGILQPAVNGETYTFLRQVAQKTNANQLESYCRYFERNMNELIE
mmetsp:Transcript_31052/g.50700  ORF Transcript_31052/g.50700 Transcript_31052/m.50700 type:complete len:773 (+) Transcript_31052:48-2366(+)|eukprot:CAMPEP_0201884908 /NCGR_PEP_ID=MMETSP0902-20130614/17613_1 /ASSEMBLY_ACC=CAM_ASM_000551 /TAXON_ID=420261 /ORGANISM="Thalassiosira antarctica, Strain CCMP982" /LENGTH=772 /DNA_ID=CAMNT_0048413923 /DNA_START=38 /DNA_END=2356 /DNA_ORIENTATION=+